MDYTDFLRGMAVCCRGTPDERRAFLFQVFDLHRWVCVSVCLCVCVFVCLSVSVSV